MDYMDKLCGISVVIPTMNRSGVLLDTLADLSVQDFEDFEVIVVDQSDKTNKSAEDLLNSLTISTQYHHVTHFRGLPEARNYGWRRAANDIIVYVDDDIRCGKDFLTKHYEAHTRTGADMVAGGITEAKGDRDRRGDTGSFNWWTATPRRNYHYKSPRWCLHAPGGNFSIRKKALREVGGLDENLTVGAALYEETEFGLRLYSSGFRCWFEPDAHLIHLASPMGGCRTGPDVSQYVYGMAHNRSILIFRHLKIWHRPTALIRMMLFSVSYCRQVKNLSPISSAVAGIHAGRKAATKVKSCAGKS